MRGLRLYVKLLNYIKIMILGSVLNASHMTSASDTHDCNVNSTRRSNIFYFYDSEEFIIVKKIVVYYLNI